MNKLYKSILSVSAATIVATASLTPAFVYAWGDSNNGRPSYTIEQINDTKLNNGKGILGDTIVFNSISNSKIGDEKNFVAAKVAGATVSTWNADEIKVEDGKTYTIRAYVHNNSPLGKDAIAKNVIASFSLPTTVAKSHTVIGYIDADNSNPKRVWDEVVLTSDEDFYIEYVEGSAQFNNKAGLKEDGDGKGAERSFKLSDEIVVKGAKLGYNAMDGNIPGCYGYSGVVTIDVKVHKSVGAELSTRVRLKGTKEWSESVNAKVGDEVEYDIKYVNLFANQVDNVMIRDILPTNIEYVANSTYLYNSNYKTGTLLKENTLTTSGINIGSYAARGNANVRFTGKVVDKTLTAGNNQLVNWASATVNGKVYKDDASVMVAKEKAPDPTPTPTPTPEPDPEPIPEKIVDTGATTIAAGALGAGAVVTSLGYFLSSRKNRK